MSLTETLLARGRRVWASLDPGGQATEETRRVLIVEPAGDGAWNVVEGEVGGDRVAVLRAERVDDLDSLADGAEVTLVSNSPKSVCRFLDLIDAAPDELRRMAALRLETELPYPVAESTWVVERREGHDAQHRSALVLATSTAEIVQAERDLRGKGIRCRGVESYAAGLAELAVACDGGGDPVAIVSFQGRRATLAIADGGTLRYVRQFEGDDGPVPRDDEAAMVAGELHQSLYDYLLRSKGRTPGRLVVTGEGADDDEFTDSLGARLGLPVRTLRWPDGVEVAAAGEQALAQFPVCAGVLLAVHRRLRGERAAAPALRAGKHRLGAADLQGKRAVLIGASVAVLVVLIASSFAVRAVQLRTAERIIEESRPLVRALDRLDEEVSFLQDENRRRRSTLDALLALSEVLPPEVQVEELTIDSKGKATIAGRTSSVRAAWERAIAAMEESKVFAKPKFMGASKEKAGFGFQITCEVRTVAGGGTS